MPKQNYQGYLRTLETPISSVSIADDDYEFDLVNHAALNNLLEYFHFVDSGGAQVDASAGTVVVTLSPGVDIFQTISEGSFDAIDARLATRTKPSGYGKAVKIKITLAGITGDPTGFAGLVTQSVS